MTLVCALRIPERVKSDREKRVMPIKPSEG